MRDDVSAKDTTAFPKAAIEPKVLRKALAEHFGDPVQEPLPELLARLVQELERRERENDAV